jgi:hypothetical protein
MKGSFRILVIGALLFGVAELRASSTILVVENSKSHYDLPKAAELQQFVVKHIPAFNYHTEVPIERVDNEVLVIFNEDEPLRKLAIPVIPKANAPPEQSFT